MSELLLPGRFWVILLPDVGVDDLQLEGGLLDLELKQNLIRILGLRELILKHLLLIDAIYLVHFIDLAQLHL